MITGVADGAVSLYYDNSKKFETTNTGAKVSGFIQVTNGVDVTGGNIDLLDNSKIRLGASQDLQIYHDGSNSYIDETGTGDLRIKSSLFRVQSSSGEAMINASENGIVQLYENNTERFRTVSDGAKVTGNLEVTGTITGAGGSFLPLIGGTMTGDTLHGDNVKSVYGTSGDLEIFHNGTASIIKDAGVGNLQINASDFVVNNSGDTKNMIIAVDGGATTLFCNGAAKLATTSTGVSVTGNGAFSGNVSVPDTKFLIAGSSGDVIIGHDGSNSTFRNSTGDLNIEQFAVTKSIIFKVSDANAGDVTALTISRNGDLTTGRDVTIAGDLTVNGTTTTVNSQTLSVDDPLISLAINNAANSLDIGYYGKYNDGTTRYLGLFNDASDSNKFKLFKGTTVEPTTTVDIGGAGYVAADLQVAGLEATSFTNTGDLFVEDNIYLTDASTTRAKIQLNSVDRDNLDIKAVSLGSTMNFFTVDTLALSLDASQNASFTGAVNLPDAKVLSLGNSLDLQIFHESNNSFISNNIGDLTIRNLANDKDIIFQSDNGSGGVETYFFLDGSLKLNRFLTDTLYNDNVEARFGTNTDLKIYHDGSNSYIDEVGTGSLFIRASDIFLKTNTSENAIACASNGAVSLYYDNAEKLATTSTGVSVTGGITAGATTLTSTDENILKLVNSAGQPSLIRFNDTSTTTDPYIGSYGNDLAFGTYGGGEKMRITSAGNVGIGTDSPDAKLVVSDAGGTGLEITPQDSLARISLVAYDRLDFAYRELNFDAYNYNFRTSGNVKAVMLNNGNVGIGTTSPQLRLDVKGSASDTNTNFGVTVEESTLFRPSSDLAGIRFGFNSTDGYMWSAASGGKLHFGTRLAPDNNINMTLDSSGNVGIGTTSPVYKLDVRSSGNLFYGQTDLNNNTSVFRLKGNGGASSLFEVKANGNVGIGTTNPTSKLVVGDLANTSGVLNDIFVTGDKVNFDGYYARLIFGNSSQSGGSTASIRGERKTDNYGTELTFYTNTTGSSGNGTERMRIDSSGNATFAESININSNNTLNLKNADNTNGFQLFNSGATGSSNANLIFLSGAVGERMRITSGGEFGFGTSSDTVINGSVYIKAVDAANTVIKVGHKTGSVSGADFIAFYYNNVQIGGVAQNGTTAVSFNTTSDYRLKEDLKDFAGLDIVSKIPVYDYKWKADKSRSYGVMAHELQDVLPDAVTGEKDAEEMQGVDYSKIVPLLVKSIQELKAKVEKLESQNCKCKI
jgi:hypothetical protein